MNNVKLSQIRPLETLVIQQLESLIKEEKSIASKYPKLHSAVDNGARALLSEELACLNRRADRLGRLLCAMEGFSTVTA